MHITRVSVGIGEAEVRESSPYCAEDGQGSDMTVATFEASATYRVELSDDGSSITNRDLESFALHVDRIGEDGDPEKVKLTLSPDEFYKLVDLLSAVGHYGEPPKPRPVNAVNLTQTENLTTWECQRCHAGGGMVGEGDGSPDDAEMVEHFWEDVARHERGECVGLPAGIEARS